MNGKNQIILLKKLLVEISHKQKLKIRRMKIEKIMNINKK